MAKKAPAADFNQSEMIREILTESPKLSSKEVNDTILAKYPTTTINKNSFSVAFYMGPTAKARYTSFVLSKYGALPTINLIG